MSDSARRARLIAEGRCVDCAQPRGDSPVATRCSSCARKHHAAQVALRRKKRLEKPWSDLTNGDPLPVGSGAPPVHAVAHLRIPLSNAALQGLNLLKKQERERCIKAGERYIGYRLSHLVREAIRTFATRDFSVPPRTLNAPLALSFQCDAHTLAIIDYHARHRFDGNRAATVRAMLAAVGLPDAGGSIPIDPGRPLRPYRGYGSAKGLRLAREDRESGEEPSLLDDPQYHWEKRQQARRDEARGEAQRQAIERQAKDGRRTRRKKFWEYSPVYQENRRKSEQGEDTR